MPIGLLAVLGAVTAALVIAQAWLLARAITSVFIGKSTLAGATLAVLAAVFAGRALAAAASAAVAARAGAAAKSQLRARLLRHAIALGPDRGKRSAAALSQLATTGLDALDGYFTSYLPALVLAVAVPLTVLGVIASADPVSGITVAVTLPLVPVFGALIGLATGREADRRWRALATLAHHFHDVVSGLTTLKVFGRDRAQRTQIERVTGDYRRATLATLRLAFLSGFALELIATMSVALVATETGLRLAYGHIGLQTGLLVLILAPEAYLPLRNVGAHFHATADGLAAASEVFAILETPARGAAGPAGGAALPGRRAAVSVSGVTVWHEGRAEPAPRDATLTLEPGRLVVLTGPSGCGKTTLVSCLLGFTEPSSGAIGNRVSPDECGWLPQHPTLFAGPVADNIRLGWPDAPDAAVAAAARAAALDDVPLDRVLGEHGGGLSAGQRRRVALARALLPARPVLLLDEPTAGLDRARETVVAATLRARAEDGAAVLVVSHRPALIAAADEVVDLGAPAVPRPLPAGVPA